jgi:hypothetical protein
VEGLIQDIARRRAWSLPACSAAIALLDRGWGKPQQAIEMDWRQKPASLMTDEELRTSTSTDAAGYEHVGLMISCSDHKKSPGPFARGLESCS